MSNRPWSNRNLVPALAGALAFLLVPAASAQSPTTTTSSPATQGEWSAWIGCWEPVESRTRSVLPVPAGSKAAGRLVCVLPTETTTAVEITTIANGQVVNQLRVDASGMRESVSREGCHGWEKAAWSTDRRRVYLSSDLTCAGDLQRRTSGILSLVPGGDWLDVQSVTIAGQTTTRAKRYREVRPTPALSARLPREVAAALAASQSLAARTARQAAALPHSLEAVIEVAGQLEAPVTTTWLIEQAQGFTISAKELRQLAAAQVPDDVIDLLVALSYPEAFAIDRTPEPDRPVVSIAPPTNQLPPGARRLPPGLVYHDWGWDPFGGWRGYSTALYYPYYRYTPYNLGGFGGGWYTGPSPVVIVVRDKKNSAAAQPGRVVNGRGYTRGSGARNNPPISRNTNPGKSTGAAAPASSGTSSGSTTRKAKPRNQE